MEVLGVLLVCGVLTLGVEGLEAKEATEAKQEVEKIFKTVEEIMTNRSSKLRRNSRRPMTFSLISKKEKSGIAESEAPTVLPSLSKPIERSYMNSRAPFPVGVVVSDHLYPLVVGRNAESGTPFVVNLDKQHAMIVAGGASGSGYRMLVPFPMMLGTPKFGGLEAEDPSLDLPPDYRNYPSKYFEYRSPHSSGILEGKNIQREHVEDYSPEKRSKYAHNYRYRHLDEALPFSGEPWYNEYPMKSTKKYMFTTNPTVRPRGKPYQATNSYGSFESDSHSTAPMRPAYLTNTEKSLSYYVEGPKVNPHVPFVLKKPFPIAYRQTGRPYRMNSPKYRSYMSETPRPSRNSHYRNYYNDHPAYRSSQTGSMYPTTVYGSVPKDFKPSPYIGEIDAYIRKNEDKDVEETTTLQPHSKLFETYDDRGGEMNSENDFDDTNSDSPEGRHASSGGVRHVTYHADDYLGKIYEEMYYKLPSTERIDTSPNVNLESRSPQVFPLQDYEGESVSTVTDAADRRLDQVIAPQTEVARRRLDQVIAPQTEVAGRRLDQVIAPQTEVAGRMLDQNPPLEIVSNIDSKTAKK